MSNGKDVLPSTPMEERWKTDEGLFSGKKRKVTAIVDGKGNVLCHVNEDGDVVDPPDENEDEE